MNFVDYLFENSGFSDNPFLVGSDGVITYASLYNDVNRVASALFERYGSGKRMLLVSENNYFFIVSYLSIIKSGNTAVLIETSIGERDLAQVLKNCSLTAYFVQKQFLDLFDDTAADIYIEDDLGVLSQEQSEFTSSDHPEDVAVIIFTSGSTGTKKGVMLTHKNLIANTDSILGYLHLTGSDRICIALPFFYCYGASLLHTHIRVGGSLVLNNKIFLGSVILDINRYQCTGFSGVPSTFQILIHRTHFLREELPSLRYFTQAGGHLPNKYIRMLIDAFPEKAFFVMYGATEATARLSYLPPHLVREKMGSIGKGIPGVTLEVVDSHGNPVHPGEIGEITAIGENIMKGYYNDPEGTAVAIRDGRYFTGDLATIDDEGYIYVVGRSKNIIKSGGYRISPNEIEDLILSLEEVSGCVVVGIPDDMMGEAVTAVVQAGCAETEEVSTKILSLCNTSLPSYKVPMSVEFVDEYPLNSSNKVDRNRLKARIMEERGLQE
ncbi:class I adenylate-forming enzyme family protein [Methanofollis formosanus]|nr:AMP-binding protein [Methanofollis formosanus]